MLRAFELPKYFARAQARRLTHGCLYASVLMARRPFANSTAAIVAECR
jgi:hypothetical protein